MDTGIGLELGIKDSDSAENSLNDKDVEVDDYAVMISRFLKVYPSMSLNDVLNLSYPQFKALYLNIYNDKTFNIVIPYFGTSDKKDDTEAIKRQIQEKGEELNINQLARVTAFMNVGSEMLK